MRLTLSLIVVMTAFGQNSQYDLILKGGRVVDPKNNISRVMDVAVTAGKIARVAANIPPSAAKQIIDVNGLYVTPGLIDIHAHMYIRGNFKELVAGENNVQADAFSFRSGVTTMVDAGTSGWRTFPDFRERVINRARTRVLALLNIAGYGMGTGKENEIAELDPNAAARMAKGNADVIVGFKAAHYNGPAWESIDNAVKAGNLTHLPVMVDFGYLNDVRNIRTLLEDKLRAGDIYTHCFSGHREELLGNGKVNPALWNGRKRGVIFDVGFGAGSFYWYVAIPAFQQGFYPDSISTDLHSGSMNSGMKTMINVMSIVLNLGQPLDSVVRMSTWNPAKEIQRPQLGNLDLGAEADIAVLRLDRGHFGFIDSAGARNEGTQMIVCEMTIRKGVVVWDLNGRASQDWKTFPYKKERWTH